MKYNFSNEDVSGTYHTGGQLILPEQTGSEKIGFCVANGRFRTFAKEKGKTETTGMERILRAF